MTEKRKTAQEEQEARMNDSFYKQKAILASKWAVYGLLLLICCILQSTPGFFQIMGIRPLLILPIVIAVASFEAPLAAGIFGACGGLLWDLTADRLFGFQGFLLLVYCVAVSLMIEYYLRLRLLNYFWMALCVVLLHALIDFYFYFSAWGYENVWQIFLQRNLPVTACTAAVSPVFYGIVYAIQKKYSKYL